MCMYSMASIFHGVLIFVIFVVDLTFMKFPPTRTILMPTVIKDEGNNCHCHTSLTLFFYLMLLVQFFFAKVA